MFHRKTLLQHIKKNFKRLIGEGILYFAKGLPALAAAEKLLFYQMKNFGTTTTITKPYLSTVKTSAAVKLVYIFFIFTAWESDAEHKLRNQL